MPSWSIILPLLAALLGAGVSAGGSYLAARRQHNLGIRHDLYREDLPELRARIGTALRQVSPPSEISFATSDIVRVAKQGARKADTGSRRDCKLSDRLHELAQRVEREHKRLVQQYGKKQDQGVPQAYEPGYFREAAKLLGETDSQAQDLHKELAARIRKRGRSVLEPS